MVAAALRIASTLRRRTATFTGAILLGLIALAFAESADMAQKLFLRLVEKVPLLPLVLTPAGFVLLAWLTHRFAPEARGSGIPQVIAAAPHPEAGLARLVSLKMAAAKFLLTISALLFGASVGREGPTVQISAAVMTSVHRLFKVPLSSAVVIAGGAAGVSAAFNTPLAGVAFALEELAAAYEQRLTLLVMAAVMISGMVSLGLAGDYLYFGLVGDMLAVKDALLVVPVAGIAGGVAGALFSRAVIGFTRGQAGWLRRIRARPIIWAGACGLTVAVLGVTTGFTWGTGYEPARALIEGTPQSSWFGLAKLISTLATTLSGIPGGIFAPSLSVGAGLASLLPPLFPSAPFGAVILVGMTAYFVGVVRAPLTSVIIITEMTGSRGMVLPLLAAAVLAEGVAAIVCPQRLYHALSKPFRLPPQPPPTEKPPKPTS